MAKLNQVAEDQGLTKLSQWKTWKVTHETATKT